MPDIALEKLKKMYEAGKTVDKKLFAEQRTNIMLRAGDHYNRKSGRATEELRSRGLAKRGDAPKIRLVKNHIHRILNVFENYILEGDPSVTISPYNPQEVQDVKSAKMHQGVLDWIKDTNKWKRKQQKFAHDFTTIGEAFAMIRWDDTLGPAIAQDEDGNVIKGGEFVIERLFAFDMKRDPAARDDDEVRWWIRDSLVDRDDFKDILKATDNKDKLNEVNDKKGSVVKIFDPTSGEYKEERNKVMVHELFMKPSNKYPEGWYCMFTDDYKVVGIELPFGVFPIVYVGFDELTTSPRSASVVRVCRPYQVEINRASSKMAEHQVTLGDDKVFIQKGTKISSGGKIAGIRAVQVAGKEPIIKEGRSGAQYLEYSNSNVNEMYQALDLQFLIEDKAPSGDAYLQLFTSMKHKRKFVKYAEKYERFEIEIFKTALKLAKRYLESYHVIKALGATEAVNIPEFKRVDNEGFEWKALPQSGDLESKFGKILMTTSVLQYAGSSLQPDELGRLIRELPMGNKEQAFSTLTVDYDNSQNDILALDRGEQVGVRAGDNHAFFVKALSHRTKKSDFKFAPPIVQQNYENKIAAHEQFIAEQLKLEQQAQAGQIPAGGFLTTVNTSWVNPETGKTERIKVPTEAIQWLVEKLSTQGFFAQTMQSLPASSRNNISSQGNQLGEPSFPEAQPTEADLLLSESARPRN